MSTGTPSDSAPKQVTRAGFVYEPAIGPGLRKLLLLIFLGFALLGATGAYLLAIRILEWVNRPNTYTNGVSLLIFLIHVLVGVALLLPFFYFGFKHWSTARHRVNRVAVKLGIWLFITGIIVCVSGVALVQIHERFQLPTGMFRTLILWTHILSPVLAVILYVLHRRAGPLIQWKWGYAWGGVVGLFIGVMVWMHYQDPHKWGLSGPKEGDTYFHPSKARTVGGKFISADTFMMDRYCMKCHQDIYNDHLHSAHKRSSFNNPPYLFSVREVIKKDLKEGKHASRWCAGCHDPVPFLSGQFDQPDYFKDLEEPDKFLKDNPTAHAGISCTVCHGMTHINSATGDADYVIDEPEHYPFATSKNTVLQWLNNQMIKAKPDFHRRTFLKPFHKSEKFCSTCHKVSLPIELNEYKEFLRGQNHYDSHLLSGFQSSARSFYYPPKAMSCNFCHMPLKESNDFGAKDFDNSGVRKIHNHFFPGANTGLPWMLSQNATNVGEAKGLREAALKNADFLRGTDGTGAKLRIDLFGVKEGGTIDGKLHVLRPDLPELEPGKTYLIEVVIRTLKVGHLFTQGTVDSNEIWVEHRASTNGQLFAINGGMQGKGESRSLKERKFITLDNREVDKNAHFVNVFMLDRKGNRINRRNAQDIFTPLYNHQIPPGAGQVVHYKLTIPEDAKESVNLKVRLRYRKFDHEYMSLVHKGKVPMIPIVDLCEDEVILPIKGGSAPKQESPIKERWQRWNDYGIGCYLEGGAGNKKGEMRQAAEAFRKVTEIGTGKGKAYGYLNLSRVLFDETKYDEARAALRAESQLKVRGPLWTVAWLNARLDKQQGNLNAAVKNYRAILDPEKNPTPEGFDFTKDYVILNELADLYFTQASQFKDERQRDPLLRLAIKRDLQTLKVDPENIDAHSRLYQSYSSLSSAFTEKVQPSTPIDELKLPRALDQLKAVFQSKLDTLTNAESALEARHKAARDLGVMITKVGEQDYGKVATKTPVLKLVMEHVVPLRDKNDANLKSAVEYVLSQAHRELHAIYKADDNAAEARRLFRLKQTPESKAADRASQAIIIYPMAPAKEAKK